MSDIDMPQLVAVRERANETAYRVLLREHVIACDICTPQHIDTYCNEGRELLSILNHARGQSDWRAYSSTAFSRPVSAPRLRWATVSQETVDRLSAAYQEALKAVVWDEHARAQMRASLDELWPKKEGD